MTRPRLNREKCEQAVANALAEVTADNVFDYSRARDYFKSAGSAIQLAAKGGDTPTIYGLLTAAVRDLGYAARSGQDKQLAVLFEKVLAYLSRRTM